MRLTPQTRRSILRNLTIATALTATSLSVSAADLVVRFSDCTEFVGLTAARPAEARALLPTRYTLIGEPVQAQLVVRVTDCASIRVGSGPARPGRVSQLGLLISSPDGTATDPNTSINNYTLSYTTNRVDLAEALRDSGVPATLDRNLAYEFAPATGTSALYAAIAPDVASAPRWQLVGTVNTPTIPIPFLANWWNADGRRQTKMETTFPDIVFDFGSNITFTTSRTHPVGALLPSGNQAGFPLSFRGAYGTATMVVTQPR